MKTDAQFIESWIREAGELIVSGQAKLRESHKYGDYRNVVTDIDLQVSDLLKQKIATEYPEDNFFSEEEPQAVWAEGRTWVVDPIDGTSNYIRSIPHYSCCITVMDAAQVETAAVYNPITKEYFSYENGEIRLNNSPVSVSSVTELKNAYVNFHPGRKAEHNEWAGDSIKMLLQNAKKTNNLGSSALDLGFLAAGRSDVVVYGSLSTLDIAGAIAMVRAAGGEVYNYETKSPAEFNPEPQRVIATATPELLEDFLKPR